MHVRHRIQRGVDGARVGRYIAAIPRRRQDGGVDVEVGGVVEFLEESLCKDARKTRGRMCIIRDMIRGCA